MKHVIIGASVALALFATTLERADALDVRHNTQLGAPVYAGPNVVIIQNGYSVTGGGLIYGQPPPRRYGYGKGYGKGYGTGHRYGYRDRPRYGHRPPPRTYYYGKPSPRYGYHPYVRERHPTPYVYGRPDYGYGHGNPRYGNPRYGTPRYANPRYANPGEQHRGPRLTILGATYRSIDGRTCDAYSYAHRKCDGTQSCTVKASNSICGDPDRGRLKVLEVSYACGNRQFTSSTPERSRSQIRCR